MASGSVIETIEADRGKVQLFAFVICTCVAVCLGGAFVVFGSSGQSYDVRLDANINPNDPNEAPVASLVRLPGIGLARAQAIVAYRQAFAVENGGNPPFRSCSDLQKVRGIGPKTVQNISQWLKFE